jgi:hypothetical protein
MLVANLITQHPDLIPTVGKVRYFPDRSGFFIVLGFDGKVLVHGDYEGSIETTPPKQLPFELPINEIITIAKQGGGYLKMNYKGYIYQMFIYSVLNSPYIVCSGLYIDTYHIKQRRTQWKRMEKTIMKKKKCINSNGSGNGGD